MAGDQEQGQPVYRCASAPTNDMCVCFSGTSAGPTCVEDDYETVHCDDLQTCTADSQCVAKPNGAYCDGTLSNV